MKTAIIFNLCAALLLFLYSESSANPSLQAASAESFKTHIVQQGDTLYSLASRYGISVSHLKDVNSLSGNGVYVGQQIHIPQAGAAPAPNPQLRAQSNAVWYTVQQGETLHAISRRHQCSVDDLLRLNKIENPRSLRSGSRILVPTASEQVVEDYRRAKSGLQPRSYIVKQGETFSAIGRKFGIPAQQIMSFNHIEDPRFLRAGTELQLPLPADYQNRHPQQQRSQQKRPAIAKTTPQPPQPSQMTPVNELITSQPIERTQRTQAAAQRNDNSAVRPSAQLTSYRVQKDDNLQIIAENFDTSVAELCRINGLDAGQNPQAGTLIKVPTHMIFDVTRYRKG